MPTFFQKLFKKKSNPDILVAIHGFGKRRTDEFALLRTYFSDKEIQIINPALFDQTDRNDADETKWVRRAEQALQEAFTRSANVYLLGFSMGGVIAAHLASKYPVKGLVLCAPAFEYLTFKQITGALTSLIGEEKPVETEYVDLPNNYTQTFMNLVSKYRKSSALVRCPVRFFHGTRDDVIPLRSSVNALKSMNLSKDKKLFILEGVRHRILESSYRNEVFLLIDQFIKNG